MIYACDLQGRFIYLNARTIQVLGYAADEAKRFLGVSFFDALPSSKKGAGAERMRSGAERPLDDHHFRLDVRRKDGTTVTLDIRATPLWHNGAVAGRVGVARPVDADAEPTIAAEVVQRAVIEDRERIARVLQTHIAEVVRGTPVADGPSAAPADDRDTSTAGDVLRRHALDDTDLAILRLVIRGASNPDIGRRVHLSAAAVKDRIGRLMRRFGAHRRAELSAQALRAGIS